MDRKKNKFASYYFQLANKSGLIVPAFAALAMFVVLFCVRLVDLLGKVKSASQVGYWILIVGALIGFILTIVYIVTKLKSKELGAQDSLLLTLDFLMVYLLLGMIIFDFVSLDTVFYAIALVITLTLTVLRVMFAEFTAIEDEKAPAPNIGLKKYFETVLGKYSIWILILAAFVTLGALLVLYGLGVPSEFLSETAYTVGWLLVGAIAFISFIYCLAVRITSRKVCSVDAFVLFALFTVIFAIIPVIINGFSAFKLAVWLLALCISFMFVRILAANTYVSNEATDDSYFVTDVSKKFKKGPKVYFGQFYKKFNVIAVLAIALVAFALLGAVVSVDFFGWLGEHKLTLFFVIAIVVLLFFELIYFATTFRRRKVGLQDAVLIVMDVALLLLIIPLVVNFGASKITSLVIWAAAFAICIGFSIARLFMVKESLPEEDVIAVEDNSEQDEAKKN